MVPASASAAERTISVGNDYFRPPDVQIAVGDTVTWVFDEAGNHNVQTRAGQAESFDSDPGKPEATIFHEAGYRFSHTFNTDNVAVDYYCRVHPAVMKGTVSVGTPPVDATPPAVTAASARVRRRTVAIGFRLDEAARITLRLARASKPRRTIRTARKQLGAGRGTITLRRRGLRPGRYVARLTAEDEAGNDSSVRRATFRLR